jgi:hypothetical protein
LRGPLLQYVIVYMYTIIPLFLFVIKKEVKIRGKIAVHNIHLFALLAYKSNAIIKNHK